jgi:hypothetical protein
MAQTPKEYLRRGPSFARFSKLMLRPPRVASAGPIEKKERQGHLASLTLLHERFLMKEDGCFRRERRAVLDRNPERKR